jgi:hypothetical protein
MMRQAGAASTASQLGTVVHQTADETDVQFGWLEEIVYYA